MTASRRRPAFTLVELLVVTGLLSALLGLLATGLRPTGASQVRQLSQSLSSAILAAQTRAIGNETGSALLIEVVGSATSTKTVFTTDVPPFIQANVLSGIPPSSLALNSTNITLTLLNADPADLSTGYRIFFSGTNPTTARSSWMGFSSSGSVASGTVTFRSAVGQSSLNSVWPTAPASSSLQCSIARRPVKSGPAADVTKLAAIDLRYSGIGNTITGNYGSLAGRGSIAITFDRTGALDAVILYGSPAVEPVNPTAPLYLLLAAVADIQDNRSLQSPTSRWIVIAPGTGRVNVAANVSVSGTTEFDINNARANARMAATGGGR